MALSLASPIRDRVLAALARGQSDLHWSSFARIARHEAGLSEPT